MAREDFGVTVGKSQQAELQLPPELSEATVAVYLQALHDGEFRWEAAAGATGLTGEALTRCRDELLAYRLLAPASGSDERFIPVNPEVAAARVVAPVEETIRSYRQAADTTTERLLQLMPAYRDHMSNSGSGRLEMIHDPADVQVLVNRAVDDCTKEMMTVQPGGKRDPAALQTALPRDLATVNRGVRVQMIYQHTTRTQLSVRSYVSAMIEAGAQVRTTDQLSERMFIFDREIAFIPERSAPDRPPGAMVVRAPVLVSFLCALFDQFWDDSIPFIPDGPGYQNVSDDLRRAIVALLAQGLKDEVVAKRLGMSVRTCRRHIASLMQELGAESRFEAGVKAAELGLLQRE